jgi:G3E family GTPase
MAGHNAAVPVTVITGFLGSGKTTVLNRLLRLPRLADTAVIVNEFGEVGLDHLLIEQAIENAVLLRNGCICCTVRGDIADTLGELFRKRQAGEIPWFRRIAIETTGLADPAPVVHTLVSDGVGCRLDGIVATVDALHGVGTLARQFEARHQVAMADRVLLTKTDLAAPAPAMAAIRAINPSVPVRLVVEGGVTAEDVFGLGPEPGDAEARLARWLAPMAHDHDHDAPDHDHHHGVRSVSLSWDAPVDPAALELWLNSLLSLRGEAVLRLKGVVQLAGEARRMVVQAVHHVRHPPAWLDGGGASQIVVIHHGLSAAGLRASFAAALGR